MSDERLTAVLADPNEIILSHDVDRLQEVVDVVALHHMLSAQEWKEVVSSGEILVHNGHWQLTREVLEDSPRLKLVCSAGTGYEWVGDMSALRRRGIDVTNVPDYATESVAELAIGLMIATMRHVVWIHESTRKGERATRRGQDLKGKNLAVIGGGHIGKRIGEIAHQGFGMYVRETHRSTERKEFDDVLRWAHVVSVSAALTPETTGMIGMREFDLIKDGVVVINVSRGKIIDEAALLHALQSGRVKSAGLDVLSIEPPVPESPLLHFENVVLSGHNGANTEEAIERLSAGVVENIIFWLEGKPKNLIN